MPSIGAIQPSLGIPIHLRGMGRTFANGVIAIDSIDLDVAAGEFLAILGPSGCGKSTLLRLVAGLDQPQRGVVGIGAPVSTNIELMGAPAADYQRPNLRRRGRAELACVFQDAHLLPWRTALKNVALPLELMGVARNVRLDAARAAIEQVGLLEAIDRYPNQLSGGQRMRISLARAVVTNPKLLLLDEPFAALDEITRQRLDEQLRELWSLRKLTVLFVTHSTQEAVFLAQRAIVMSQRPGKIIHAAPIDLPPERPGAIRGTPAFAREMRTLFDALERGGA